MKFSARPLPLLSLLFAAAAAFAQPRTLEEGVHYQVIDPSVPTATDADHIEVREMFWYGCSQCAVFEPMMRSWRDGVTGDLVFQRTPAVWNGIMETHARIFYAGDQLNLRDRVNQAAFHAVQQQGNALRTEEQIRAFFAGLGVNEDAFEAAWKHESVTAAVESARMRSGDYGLDKVPAVIVNGMYRATLNAAVPTHDDLIITVNLLIKKLRDIRRTD